MTRYFYTDPLAAAWMAMVFGIRMRVEDNYGSTCAMGDWLMMAERERHFRRAHVHSEDDGKFACEVGDVLWKTLKLGSYEVDVINLSTDFPKKLLERGWRIIQRNGVAFHWPESEAE